MPTSRPPMMVAFVDPEQIRYTQEKIAVHFKDGRSIYEMIYNLLARKTRVEDIIPIKVRQDGKQLYSIDNRRLWCFKRYQEVLRRFDSTAEVKVPVAFCDTMPEDGRSTKIPGISVELEHPPLRGPPWSAGDCSRRAQSLGPRTGTVSGFSRGRTGGPGHCSGESASSSGAWGHYEPQSVHHSAETTTPGDIGFQPPPPPRPPPSGGVRQISGHDALRRSLAPPPPPPRETWPLRTQEAAPHAMPLPPLIPSLAESFGVMILRDGRVCVRCDDAKQEIFQCAKLLPYQVDGSCDCEISSLKSHELGDELRGREHEGWSFTPNFTRVRVVRGRHFGAEGLGVGCNKTQYERAAYLACAVAMQLEIQSSRAPDPSSDGAFAAIVREARNYRGPRPPLEPPRLALQDIAAAPPSASTTAAETSGMDADSSDHLENRPSATSSRPSSVRGATPLPEAVDDRDSLRAPAADRAAGEQLRPVSSDGVAWQQWSYSEGRRWWSNPDSSMYFFEDDPGDWSRRIDERGARWQHAASGYWFYEPARVSVDARSWQ